MVIIIKGVIGMMVVLRAWEERGHFYEESVDTDDLTDEEYGEYIDLREGYDHETGEGREQAWARSVRFLRRL